MIRVELFRANQGVVIQSPRWWQRLFLFRRQSERFIERVPTLPRGCQEWLYDDGRPVGRAVRKAIGDEVRRLEWERIWEKRRGR